MFSKFHLYLNPFMINKAIFHLYSTSLENKVLVLSEYTQKLIRNFCLIAHVDHGKSTLADRLLEITGAIIPNSGPPQILDKLNVERTRGITVKAQTAALFHTLDNHRYLLNLVDTPGHADFAFEVKRSLMACDNAILIVDANEGVMAQTISTFNLASLHGLKIIPVINKIDVSKANINRVKAQLKTILGIDPRDVLIVSAKHGTNVSDVLAALILDGKPPSVDNSDETQAHCVVIDSEHHPFRGTVVTIIVRSGQVKLGTEVKLLKNSQIYKVREVGVFTPNERPCDTLYPGQVGYVAMGIKTPAEVRTGDVFFTGSQPPDNQRMTRSKPMVFAGLYPMNPSTDHLVLKTALEKLCLNDSSVDYTIENHPALGTGWRLGFYGLLHMEVFRQRLEDEYGANLILTSPSVSYRVRIRGKKNIQQYGGEWITVHNIYPPESIILEYEEMHVEATIILPESYLSDILKLCLARRGKIVNQNCMDENRLLLTVDFPLSEIIVDFYDQLKTLSSGFSSFEFVETGWRSAELVRLTVVMNGDVVNELTQLVPKALFRSRARQLADALAVEIPRQQFLIRIQVMAGGRSMATAEIKPFRKDVTAKLHAADPTRRSKLLQRQAEGKKRLRMIGKIAIPRDAFINVLKKPI